MNVLGIFGSPRRGGNTEILLEEALKGAEKEGAKIERLYLSDFTLTPCKECHGCDRTGNCVILDDMQKVYPRLLESDVVILASPIFFYGVTAWAKALIDRSQAFWARKYLVKDPSLGKEGKKRKGFFISVGATKGPRVFDGAVLTVKYFFDVLNAEYVGELVFRGVEAKGDILKHPEALQEAFEAGKRLVSDLKKNRGGEQRGVRLMTQWKCSNCGYTFGADTVPEQCPSCKQACTFSDVTCYIPDCGGPGNIDPRLVGKKDKPAHE